MTREHDLDELAIDISSTLAKARHLNLDMVHYILSMALMEVLEATETTLRATAHSEAMPTAKTSAPQPQVMGGP